MLLRWLIVLLLTGGTVTASRAADTDSGLAMSIQRGAYLAILGDCTACHTAPGGAPFAGGLPIASPVGTIFATNITPSDSAGIGDYSEADFARAVQLGIRKDGGHLYPAMPYTSYRLFTDAEVHDLYNYFQHSVAAVDVVPQRTALPFPMNIRMSMIFWNLLFFSDRGFTPNADRTAEWNRGAYLVTGPLHCGTCHTPRGFLMQEISSRDLAGGQTGSWFSPNITSDPGSGIGGWTQAEIVQYLRTGYLPAKARAADGMGEAVEHSFQYLTQADLDAVASYLHTVPAVHDDADRRSRFDYGTAVSALATLRGSDGVVSSTGVSPTGPELFVTNCASCHSPDGAGSKDRYYPSLFHNSATGGANPDNLIATILYGVDRKTSGGQAYMPGFGGKRSDPNQLDDHAVSLLASYVIAQFGRDGVAVSDSDVAQVRQGGPSSPLVLLARIGLAAAAFVFLALGGFIAVKFSRKRRTA